MSSWALILGNQNNTAVLKIKFALIAESLGICVLQFDRWESSRRQESCFLKQQP